jgi:SsrA-binding protein
VSVGVETVVSWSAPSGAAPAVTAKESVPPAASRPNATAAAATLSRLTPNLFIWKTASLSSDSGPILAAVGRASRLDTSVAKINEKLIVDNRRARHDYHLLERIEAGIVLTGTEVKSLRDGRASLQQAYADLRDGEAWLVGAHISVYEQGNIANHDPDRDRKLLLHKKEAASLAGKVAQRGLTLVPTKLYFKNGRAKVELALARGKEVRDKRRDIARREADRDMERALKSRR